MDYHFKSPGKTCATTGRALVPGSVCHSVLLEKNGVLMRMDYSEEGWQGPPAGHIGYWKIVVPTAQDPREQQLDPDAAFRYFEQLCEESSPTTVRERYVLSLVLLQHRRLKLDSARTDDDGEILELSGRDGEGNYEVQNLKLSDAETQLVQAELKVHLATEWN